MDMDDPWGSPWADEVQIPHPITTKQNDEVARPKTPAKTATLALEGKINSPWDDVGDDGFGEWSAMPTGPEKALGFDGANDGWDRKTVDDAPLKKENGIVSLWDDNASISDAPKLAPSALPKHTIRQPSPDPWATEFALHDGETRNDTAEVENQDVGGRKSEDLHVGHAEGTLPAADMSPIDGEQLLDASLGEPAASEVHVDETTVNGLVESGLLSEPEPKPEKSSTTADVEDPEPTPQKSSNAPDAEPISSRPSSSPSDSSHHDEALQESPRTSLDDEPKRPQAPRKVSSKIQELVEHFDGLAKQEEVGEPILSRKDSKTKEDEAKESEKEDEDDMDDFGDFEEGHSDSEDDTVEVKPQLTGSTSKAEELAVKLPGKSGKEESSPVPNRLPKKDFGPVEFSVDLSVLDSLFAGTDPKPSEETAFIPDTIPDNSFSSTEQRKTWYRISRYGPMRKHNTGDDENYVRVNWAQSQVREDTLKIVARWMEEDRISGQVVLGGGGKTSSIFGWNDPKTAPVPLSSAFAARRGHKPAKSRVEPVANVPREWPTGPVRTRSSSKSPSTPKTRRKSSTKSLSIPEVPTPVSQPPVANFGWNSSPQNKQGLIPQILLTEKSSSASGSKPTLPPVDLSSTPQKSTSSAPMIPTPESLNLEHTTPPVTNGPEIISPAVSKTPARGPPLSLAMGNLTNVDDDWGEMISSPALMATPVPLPSKTLRHNKSQSLGGAFRPTMSSPLATSPLKPAMSPARGHRPAMSFDDILVPQNQSPITSSTQKFDIPAFTTPTTNDFINAGDTSRSADQVPKSEGPHVTSGNADPWDFSFFDSAPAPLPPEPTSVPISKAPAKSVSFSNATTAEPPRRSQKPREEIEQDRIVQSIVKALPDLSYMLRR
jgi:hypothetical protein